MAGWGVRLLGFNNLMKALGEIQTQVTETGVFVVGTNASYGAFVEFGTSSQSAQPFLIPAAREAQRNPAAYIQKHTGTSIDQLESTKEVVKVLALAIERDAKERAAVDVGNLKASITSAELSEWPSAAEEAIESAPDPDALRR